MNNTKIIVILEDHADSFKVIYVDTTPMITDHPAIDSLILENWAVENSATGAPIVDVAHFDTYVEAQAFAKPYSA